MEPSERMRLIYEILARRLKKQGEEAKSPSDSKSILP